MSWFKRRARLSIEEQALGESDWARIRHAIVESPWLAGTTLNMRFAATWGFSVAFRRSGLAEVYKNFPAFVPYLERVLEADHNAFFLNPLVIFRGGSVMPHIDCSLRSYTAPLEPPYPVKVSVFYAQVPPELEGGELLLSDSRREVGRVKPRNNMLVQFEGSLLHQVTPFEGSREADLDRSRISLVCEHYRVSDSLLARVPRFHLESSRSFGDFLELALESEGIGNEP